MILALYALPAFIALLFKCYFLSAAMKNSRVATKLIIALLVATSSLNIFEILFFVTRTDNQILLRLYYVAAICSLILISQFVINLTRTRLAFFNVLHGFGLFLAPLLILTNFIVEGMRPMGISVTRVPGDYYYLFQLFVVCQLSTTGLLIIKAMFSENQQSIVRAKSSILFATLLPMFLTVFIILSLMSLGVNINMVIILPITSTIFLWGCFYVVTSKRIIDLSTFIPATPSWKKKRGLLFFLYAGSDKSQVWKSLLKLERLYIEEAMHENKGKGQLTKAAKSLGITPGKLDYRLKSIHQMDDK